MSSLQKAYFTCSTSGAAAAAATAAFPSSSHESQLNINGEHSHRHLHGCDIAFFAKHAYSASWMHVLAVTMVQLPACMLAL
jgi:hypothetical protein